MSVIGYARVSTTDQDTGIQRAALEAAGCTVIRMEKVSGGSREGRTELDTVLAFLQPGDTLVVAKLDRLGRSTRDVLNIVHEIDSKGASLRVLEPAIDTSGPMGRMVITTLAMVAEMELGFIRERQRAGIERAKVEGRYTGGTAKIDREAVGELHRQGLGATEIARRLGIGRASVYRLLQEGRSVA